MKSAFSFLMGLVIFGLLFFSASIPAAAYVSASSAAIPATIASYDANVLGVKVHYTMAGRGPAVILLHGYAETSRMWMPILPVVLVADIIWLSSGASSGRARSGGGRAACTWAA